MHTRGIQNELLQEKLQHGKVAVVQGLIKKSKRNKEETRRGRRERGRESAMREEEKAYSHLP